MATLAEDLERMAASLRTITDHPIERVGNERVDVNIGYREAVTLEPRLTPEGLRWELWVLAWDQTGGISDEKELGSLPEAEVLPRVEGFLREYDRRNAELEEMFRSED